MVPLVEKINVTIATIASAMSARKRVSALLPTTNA
jgi:hypothetical protein